MSFIGDLAKAGISADGQMFKFLGKVAFESDTAVETAAAVALSLTKTLTFLTTNATHATASDFTLANGATGQLKIILLKTKGTNSAVVTPANLAGGTTITMNAAGDAVALVFDGTDWHIIGSNSVTVA